LLSITRKSKQRIKLVLEDGREIMFHFQVQDKRVRVGIEAPKTILIERLDDSPTPTT